MASVEHMRQGAQQQNVPQSAGAQPGNQSENDPIYRFKLLLPRLKESLVVSFDMSILLSSEWALIWLSTLHVYCY